MSNEELLAALGRAPARPQAAPAAAPQAMSNEELMRALGQQAPTPRRNAPAAASRPRAAPAAAPAVDEYSEPLVVERQTTPEGTTYLTRPLAEGETPESLTARGMTYDAATGVWRLPRDMPDVEVVGQRDSLEPMPLVPAAAPPNKFSRIRDKLLRTPVIGPFLSQQAGLSRGANRIFGNVYGLAGQAVDRLGQDDIGNAMIDQANAYQNFMDEANAPYREANTFSNQLGQFTGETAVTAPVGGLAGRGITAAGQGLVRFAPRAMPVAKVLERVGQSTSAGGFLPSAVRRPAAGAAPTVLEGVGNLAVRGTGGGINAGIQGALIDPDDTAAGAAVGALLPTVAARPAKYALNQLLRGYETLSGKLGPTRAAEIVRRSLGVDYDTALTALRNAGPDVTAQQALVEAGVEPSAFMAVGAAAREAAPDPYLAIEAAQRRAMQAPIDRLAGGANLTEAQLAQRAEKAALRNATALPRGMELARANASGTLDVAPVSAALMAQADAPGVGTTNSRVLAEIAAGLDAMAARRGGVASADDIYAFRKDDLDDIISRALSGQRGGDITSQAARRSEMVRSAQRMLDDAIEAAGGSGWRTGYLEPYASGSETIRRQEMMGVAAKQLRQAPNAFVNLVEGETPDVVSGVFGGNRIDLRNLMNPTGVGPSGMDALDNAARQIRRNNRVGELAQEGRGVAQELLREGGGRPRGVMRGMATALGRVFRPGTTAAVDFATMLVDAQVAPQVRRELAKAYQSGANMDQLLNMVPLATRAQMQRNMMNPAFWSHLTGAAANAMAEPPANTMSAQ
jgi:hypothetical protein